jgi:hypothetical protein
VNLGRYGGGELLSRGSRCSGDEFRTGGEEGVECREDSLVAEDIAGE